jgi:hypothetical protein
VQALPHFLRLDVEDLLRHLLPGEAQVAGHGDHPQTDRAAGRKVHRPAIAVVLPLAEEAFDRLVGEVARGYEVRHAGLVSFRGPPAFGQVDLDEIAVLSAEAAEGMQGLDHAGPLRPAASRPGGQGQHGHRAGGQGRLAQPAALAVDRAAGRAVEELVAGDVLDRAGGGQAVLRQPDAAGAKVGADLLVQLRIEAVFLQEPLERHLAELVGGRRRENRGKEQVG